MSRNSAQPQLTEEARCSARFSWALRELNARPSLSELERYSRIIWTTLSSQARLFHNAEHVLKLAERGDAIQTLAALFHDAVYIQVDGGLAAPVYDLLSPCLIEKQGQLFIKDVGELQSWKGSAMVAHLFNYQAAAPQLANQHNELLSALLAVACLERLLDWGDLAQIAVAIEASIPFRTQPKQSGASPAEQLWMRLQQANQRFALALEGATIKAAIHRAIAFANRDVNSFASTNPAIFLGYTWQLLPEFNPALRNPLHYSVTDYRKALQGMEAFIQALEAESIFQQFRQYPDGPTCRSRERRARQNLAVANLYLQTKIVAVALLEALAPFYPSSGSMAEWLSPEAVQLTWGEHFGPLSLSHPLSTVAQTQALYVAEQGRHGICHFDLSHSPLAAFLIRTIGFGRIEQLRCQADALFVKRIGARDFLDQCEAKVVQAITRRLLLSA